MKITNREQMKVGLYLQEINHPERIEEIIALLDESEKAFGHPSFVAVQTQKNGIQKFSFKTITEIFEVIDKEDYPELFL